ncbi:MAG: CDP-glucose 4,6-dehydratase [Candidatus Riflebacteria bacterium]|nr:CDP-glucose 4,6-dehydratase [Candidatus Riflebacteria bacterium]
MKLFNRIYQNRRVLVTGHSGFKGSWLALWLRQLGAKVSGIALPPETAPSHWELLNLDCESYWIDIRNLEELRQAVIQINPEIIFHLAAQPLVRRSYQDPLTTWQTNLNGTVNLLEAARECKELKAVVCITTDKCYENKEWCWGYREIDALGGHDPYSASKAAAEIAIASYRSAFFSKPDSPLLASARAGNVIGGGDWAEDRIIPDMVRAIADKKPLEIRSPNATRPWQHVLESLYGYLLLGQNLFEKHADFATAWNFGPDVSSNCTVAGILERIKESWTELEWFTNSGNQPHEANLLYLDSAKARNKLNWRPIWDLSETLSRTSEWYKSFLTDGRVLSCKQLEDYCAALLSAEAKTTCL